MTNERYNISEIPESKERKRYRMRITQNRERVKEGKVKGGGEQRGF